VQLPGGFLFPRAIFAFDKPCEGDNQFAAFALISPFPQEELVSQAYGSATSVADDQRFVRRKPDTRE